MKHYWYQVSTVLLGIMLVSLFTIVYFLYVKKYEPFTVSRVENITTELRPGDTFQYRVDYCKNMPVPATVSKILVNSVFIPFTPYVSQLPVGCSSAIVSQELPKFIDPGTYHIIINTEYHVNPLRSVFYQYKTPDFIVK